MDRHAPKGVDLQSKVLKRGNRILSSVNIQEKKNNERKGKTKIRKGKCEQLCKVSSGFKNPTVVLECIDTSYMCENLQKKRVVFGDKTNIPPKTFCDKRPKIVSLSNSANNANRSLKNRGMDTSPKSQIRQSPRIRAASGDLSLIMKPCSVVLHHSDVPNLDLSFSETASRKQTDRDDGSVLKTLSNNSSVDIQNALQTSSIKSKHCFSKSKTTVRNMKPVENCQNINEDSTLTRIACESSKENRKDGKRVLSNQDSPSLRRRSKRHSFQESQLCEKESEDSKNSSVSQRNINSADVSEKTVSHCVYSKVQRDTMKNNSMPIEEKLALYEFEVDENEPLVKRKQKRNVYVKRRRRNLLSDPAYHSSLKVAGIKPKNPVHDTRTKKLQEPAEEIHSVPQVVNNPPVKVVQNPEVQTENLECVNIDSPQEKVNSSHNNEEKHVHFDVSGMEKKAIKSPIPTLKKINSAPLLERHINSMTHVSESGEILNEIENMTLSDTPKSGGSRTCERVKRRVTRENLENCPPKTPITRPGRGRTPLRKFKELEECSEFQMEWSGNGCNLSLSENQSTELQNVTKFGTSIGSMRILDKSDLMNKPNVESCPNSTSKRAVASHSTPEKMNSEKANVTGTEKEDSWSPIPAVQSPSFSSVDKGDETRSSINSSLNKSLYQSLPLSRKVFLPRISGGGNNIASEEGPDKKWDVENCFGFNDENEEEEVVPLFKIPSANKSTSKRPLSSTPMNYKQPKPLPTRLNVKRKIETLSDRPCKSPRLEEKSDKILKTLSNTSSDITPFSNPLKQTKLDFTYGSVTNTSCKASNKEATSPALFKDDSDDDKTPTHFTQPPRRSYNRLLRKNLKFVGDDWIEVDEDDDGESQVDEEKSRSRRTKKSKSSKKEEIEARKWIKDFNDKCEEIEDFELCVE